MPKKQSFFSYRNIRRGLEQNNSRFSSSVIIPVFNFFVILSNFKIWNLRKTATTLPQAYTENFAQFLVKFFFV